MEIDNDEQQIDTTTAANKIDQEIIRDSFIMMAKNLEIMRKSISRKDQFSNKMEENMEKFINEAQEFRYINILAKKEQKALKNLEQLILSVANSIIYYLVNNFKEQKMDEIKHK